MLKLKLTPKYVQQTNKAVAIILGILAIIGALVYLSLTVTGFLIFVIAPIIVSVLLVAAWFLVYAMVRDYHRFN